MATAPGGSNGSHSVEELITATLDSMTAIWDSMTGQTSNLHDLPHQITQEIYTLYSRLTQSGSLPTLQDLPQSLQWSPPPPSPPPQPTLPSATQVALHKLQTHKYLAAFLATSLAGGATYYCFPATFHRRVVPLFRPLKALVPLRLLPDPRRPARATGPGGDEVRKEAVLLLGAEGLAVELALDFEARGFVVIATVSKPELVDVLEKKSRGWMKVLVLDPSEASSVGPFLRSLSTALSLRFPLHTAGDPFSRPSHTLALTTVLNALPLHPYSDGLRPVEGTEPADVKRMLGERIATFVGVIGGVMPILRTMASRPAAPEGVMVTLVPAVTSSLSLPFQSLVTATNAATTAILDSLRRELTISSSSGNIRLVTLSTGFFELSSTASSMSTATLPQPETLPIRLSSLYAGALARRQYVGASAVVRRGGRKASAQRKLSKKVFAIVVHGRGGTGTTVGAGAFTYYLTSLLPTFFIDSFLSFQDRLLSLAFAHRRLHTPVPSPATSSMLPSPALRPAAAATAPISPAVSASSSSRASTSASASALPAKGKAPQTEEQHPSDTESDGEVSSIEDFGVGSGMGSFVGVDKPPSAAP